MRLEHTSAKDIKKDISRVIGKHLDRKLYQAFIFGSRVTGKGDERSDIDVGITGLQKVPLETLSKIKEELDDLPTLYKVDVVDFFSVSEKFKKVALEHIEEL